MKSAQKIFLKTFLILVAILFIETPFRIYDYGFKLKSTESKILMGESSITFDEVQAYLFKTGRCIHDPKLIWRHTRKNQQYQFNILGLHAEADEYLNRPKDANSYRIIIMGGSCPFGIGVNYGQTYAKRLEGLFKKEQYKWNKKVEVINAAVPGYSTLQVLNLLKYHMIGYRPDLVIIDAGTNDGIPLSSDFPWADSERAKISPFICRALNLLERSSFFWYYRKFLNDIFILKKRGGKDLFFKHSTRVSEQENINNLQEIKRLSQEGKFRILFISQLFLDKNKILQRSFGAKIEPYLDIYRLLKEKERISDYFIDNFHYTPDGHLEVAKIIYGYIEANSQFCIGFKKDRVR